MDILRQVLLDGIRRNRTGEPVGIPSVCSSHPEVLRAAMRSALKHGAPILIEATSNQVNQFGGYSGRNPSEFKVLTTEIANSEGMPLERIILGGDHLGTNPWMELPADEAMKKACDLVSVYVKSGYRKIHLDPSFPCADDPSPLDESIIIDRSIILARTCESAYTENPPLYVIGTEVPAPGGASGSGTPEATKARDVHRILELFRNAFLDSGLQDAWKRVIALVVQPEMEFGDNTVRPYASAPDLSEAILNHGNMVYEAHSTDYQTEDALFRLVNGHFFFLKVGPWLTFTLRETLLLMDRIDQEKSAERPANFRDALLNAITANPGHWRKYYRGNESPDSRMIHSYLDRTRYYLEEESVMTAQLQLYRNLESGIPDSVLNLYLPVQYEKISRGILMNSPRAIVLDRICQVLDIYMKACGFIAASGK